MRKVIGITLALLLCLTACGNATDETGAAGEPEAEETTVVESPSAGAEVTDETEDAELCTFTCSADGAAVQWADVDLDDWVERNGWSSATENADGSITFELTTELRDLWYLAVLQQIVKSYENTILESDTYPYIISMEVQDRYDVLICADASYSNDDNSVANVALKALMMQMVDQLQEYTPGAIVGISIETEDGGTLDFYILS